MVLVFLTAEFFFNTVSVVIYDKRFHHEILNENSIELWVDLFSGILSLRQPYNEYLTR